jgi:Ran GTPase-activating protein (RanGAP) involved in mRNA processing and transport
MQTFEIDTLDLSLNRLTDLGCKHLGDMLQTDKKLKKLDLGKNINITKEGFKTIIKGIK